MWSYYGGKFRLSKFYPEPTKDKIIEPFAGSAQYALRYFDRDVLLIEKYDVIVKIWKWLQKASEKDIISLPRLSLGQSVDEFTWDCDEARWLMGMVIAAGVSSPRKKASKWATAPLRPNRQNYTLNKIAGNLHKIRHWEIREGSFEEIKNEDATWFIDPPYQHGGSQYKHSDIDYGYLSEWSKERCGQVIVCENTKANWMKFSPIAKNHGVKHTTMECMWYKTA